ncbi:MAG: M67 family metallopeptidase [Conexivisphaerales archaeon]
MILQRSMVKELLEHMRSKLPYESVAFLLGSTENGQFTAEEIVEVSNAAHSRVEFAVDPQELFNVYNKGREIVSIFHSHPGPAVPSDLDAFYMKLNPVPWLIASSVNGELRAYVLNKKVSEIKVIII